MKADRLVWKPMLNAVQLSRQFKKGVILSKTNDLRKVYDRDLPLVHNFEANPRLKNRNDMVDFTNL